MNYTIVSPVVVGVLFETHFRVKKMLFFSYSFRSVNFLVLIYLESRQKGGVCLSLTDICNFLSDTRQIMSPYILYIHTSESKQAPNQCF